MMKKNTKPTCKISLNMIFNNVLIRSRETTEAVGVGTAVYY